MNKAMLELIEEIKDITGREVHRANLEKWLYGNKMPASRLCYILMTASRLVREDYLAEFEKEGVWDK